MHWPKSVDTAFCLSSLLSPFRIIPLKQRRGKWEAEEGIRLLYRPSIERLWDVVVVGIAIEDYGKSSCPTISGAFMVAIATTHRGEYTRSCVITASGYRGKWGSDLIVHPHYNPCKGGARISHAHD